jgi:hypothetical protein
MDTEDGKSLTVLNLLNLPSNGLILGQKELPEPFLNGVLTLASGTNPERVTWLDADDDSLNPLELAPASREGGRVTYHLPPVESWAILVIHSQRTAKAEGR